MEKTDGFWPTEEQNPKPTLTRHRNLTNIHTSDGVVSFLYGYHHKEEKTVLPPSTGGIALEMGETRWDRHPEKEIQYFRTNWINREYHQILAQAEERRIPVYLLDPVWKHTRRRLLSDAAIAFVEGVAGMQILKSIANEKNDRIKTTTDNISTTIRGTLAGWALSPIVTSISREISTVTNIGHFVTAPLHKLSHRLHPEQFLLTATLRNLVIAEKLMYLLPRMEESHHLLTVIGGAHTGIEDHIQKFSSADRMKWLRWCKPLLNGAIPDTFSQIIRCDYRENKWQKTGSYEVETLKKILQTTN